MQKADDPSNNVLSCGFLYNQGNVQKNIEFKYYGGLYVVSGTGIYIDAESGKEYPVYPGKATTEVGEKIKGKKFMLNENRMGISEIAFDYDNDGNGVMKYTNSQGYKELKFGIGKAVIDEFPQDGYFGDTIGVDSGRRYRCISSGAWTTENTLHIKADVIDDYFGNVSIIVNFKGDEIGIYMQPHAEWFMQEYNGFAGGKIAE